MREERRERFTRSSDSNEGMTFASATVMRSKNLGHATRKQGDGEGGAPPGAPAQRRAARINGLIMPASLTADLLLLLAAQTFYSSPCVVGVGATAGDGDDDAHPDSMPSLTWTGTSCQILIYQGRLRISHRKIFTWSPSILPINLVCTSMIQYFYACPYNHYRLTRNSSPNTQA